MKTSKAAPATWPEIERRAQRRLVDQTAARAIDDANSLFGLGDVLRGKDVLRLRGQRRVQRDDVRAGEEVVQFDLLHPDFHRALVAEKRVIGEHAHLEADAARGDDRSDIAAADDPERLAGDLDAHEAVLLPLARLCRRVGGRNLPRQREHQRNGVFGGRDRIAERRIHDDHAARGRGGDVDVVDADARAPDDLQLRCALEQFGRDLRRRTNREPVIVADDAGELVLVEAGLYVHLDAALLEDRDGGWGEFVRDENARGHGGFPVSRGTPSRSRGGRWREASDEGGPDAAVGTKLG